MLVAALVSVVAHHVCGTALQLTFFPGYWALDFGESLNITRNQPYANLNRFLAEMHPEAQVLVDVAKSIQASHTKSIVGHRRRSVTSTASIVRTSNPWYTPRMLTHHSVVSLLTLARSGIVVIDLSYQPPNVQFEIDDLEESWNFSYPFDYIHALMMTGAFRDWPNFYRQAFE